MTGGYWPPGGTGQQVVVSQKLIFNQQIHSVLTAEKLVFWETNTGAFVTGEEELGACGMWQINEGFFPQHDALI